MKQLFKQNTVFVGEGVLKKVNINRQKGMKQFQVNRILDCRQEGIMRNNKGNKPGAAFFCWLVYFQNRKQKQATTEGWEQSKIAYRLNATSHIKLQIWQLDGPTCGQGTLLFQGTKLQQELMQDWEMQSNRLDCWVRQKETKRMSDKKGKKKEQETKKPTHTKDKHI